MHTYKIVLEFDVTSRKLLADLKFRLLQFSGRPNDDGCVMRQLGGRMAGIIDVKYIRSLNFMYVVNNQQENCL